MTNERFRAEILEGAAVRFASSGAASPGLLALLGELSRVSCSDGEDDGSGEGASLADRADALIEQGRAAYGAREASKAAPREAPALIAWLDAPRRPFASALAEVERLGAITAGLGVVAPGGAEHQRALETARALSLRIGEAARHRSAEMFDAAVAASELIAERGVVPGADDALIALSEVVGQRLEAALRGEPLEAPRAFRLRTIDAGLSGRLGEALARALSRERPLEVAPDVMELARGAGRWRGAAGEDLVLHEARAGEGTDRTPVEILPGVRVVFAGVELEVELDVDEPALLLPIVSGEPSRPCPSRSGAHPRHLVFTLDEGSEEPEGYALVIGERTAFLSRR